MLLLDLSSKILHFTSSERLGDICERSSYVPIFGTVLEIFVDLGIELLQDCSQKIVSKELTNVTKSPAPCEMQYI